MLLLATEIWKSHGGIQRYMRMVCRILADRGEEFATLALLDEPNHRPGDASFSTTCCSGSKWSFCVEAFRLATKGAARTCIVGHIAFLPLVWVLRQVKLIHRYAIVLHGLEAWYRLSWISRSVARKADVIIATTHYTGREFCFHNGLNANNCVVIPLACNFCASAIRRAGLRSELRVLTVTRLSVADAYKGIDTLLRAVRAASDAGVKLTLDVVGSGNDKERLEDLARSLGVHTFVRFRGSAPDEELEQLLAESDVFAMPSKKEGFGIVFLEAMAAGLPCIGANHGGTPEVIVHGESGFLIEYGDADQLAFYLRALSQSPGLREAMARAAYRRATETLSFDVMARSWNHLIERLENQGSEAFAALEDRNKVPTVAP